ncbi:MAG: PqqD family protein [Magnetococcales bacterium]|nr:PqqD family protein [Magnetococcales bacterium]
MEWHRVVRRSSHVLVTEVDGEVVMMSPDRGLYFGLQGSGGAIWRLLEQPITVESLLARLKEHYTGDPEEMRRETLAFLEELAKHELLERLPRS